MCASYGTCNNVVNANVLWQVTGGGVHTDTHKQHQKPYGVCTQGGCTDLILSYLYALCAQVPDHST
jgi:hypothetical protein